MRGSNPALFPRREMASDHHRPAAQHKSWNGEAGARPSRPATDQSAAAPVADRSLSAVHPPDLGKVSNAGRQQAVRHGARARLPRQPPSLPASHRMPATTSKGRSLFASAHAARRAGPEPAPAKAGVDWAHFGHLVIGRARRPLMAFVMVLSYSRHIFLRFFVNARMENFLRGHVEAFEAWSGVPKVILYDNLKSAVVERQGNVIRFHPTLFEFAGRYRFDPRPVAVARGNEKGRVEPAIRYIRTGFFAARDFADLDDLNAQADVWCRGLAADRPCPEQNSLSVREAFAAEAQLLLKLPDNAYPLHERVAVTAGKTPYVRFDLNDYSIPHTHVRRPLTVLADPNEVRIVDGQHILARHRRSYHKGAQIEDAAHIQALVEQKHAAHQHRGADRLSHAAPASKTLLIRAAERGSNLGSITAALLRLLDRYGAAELQAAIIEALDRNVPHPSAVRLALERRRHELQQLPPVAANLPDHVQARDVAVRPPRLELYDQLKRTSDE